MTWTIRNTIPDVTIKYYRGVGYYVGTVNGVNECLVRDTVTGWVLPNCVGYTWGRWYEAFRTRPNLSRADAYRWYGYNQAGGYYSYGGPGDPPRIGAIACFLDLRHPAEGGHVSVVEYMTGSIPVTSNSGYSGNPDFWMEALVWTGTTWQRGYNAEYYQFQGWIYPPGGGDGSFKPWILLAGQRRFPNGRGRIINNRRF